MNKKNLGLKLIKKEYEGVLYILPSFLLIIVFSLIPLIMTGYFGFTDYNVMQSPRWIGLDNFKRLLGDPFFKPAIWNTVVYTAITVPIQTILALVIAFVIADSFQNKFGGFIRSSLFIPVISSMILVGTVWKFMLATESGIINTIISVVGINKINWLGEYKLAMISVCIVAIWKNVGYFLVIYYAGIMDIPRSHFEAAKVDGATKWQTLRYIVIPHLRPITYLVVTLGTIWSFQVFDLVYIMTGGGPGTATVTMVMSIYQNGFKHYRMGYASAMSAILFVLVLVVSIVQKRLFNKDESGKEKAR